MDTTRFISLRKLSISHSQALRRTRRSSRAWAVATFASTVGRALEEHGLHVDMRVFFFLFGGGSGVDISPPTADGVTPARWSRAEP